MRQHRYDLYIDCATDATTQEIATTIEAAGGILAFGLSGLCPHGSRGGADYENGRVSVDMVPHGEKRKP